MTTDKAKMFSQAIGEIALIERHIKMLKVTKEHQPIGIIRLSEILDIPKHKVRYSLRLLEQEGLIIATNEGAMVSDKYDEFVDVLSEYLDELEDRINTVRSELPPKE